MNPEQSAGTADAVRLMEDAFGAAAEMMAAVPAGAWDAPSPCAGWTVRQVGGHLVGNLAVFERFLREEPLADVDAEAAAIAGADPLGDEPAKALRAVGERCAAAASAFGPLDREVPFALGPASGLVVARVCLMETLVHGWDMAQGSGAPYRPDGAVIGAVAEFVRHAPIEERRAAGRFGPELAAGPDDSPFNRLLAYLGRRRP
ncbi:MAG: TIGR03086 family metal-binding protein [Spirillospora sp.]